MTREEIIFLDILTSKNNGNTFHFNGEDIGFSLLLLKECILRGFQIIDDNSFQVWGYGLSYGGGLSAEGNICYCLRDETFFSQIQGGRGYSIGQGSTIIAGSFTFPSLMVEGCWSDNFESKSCETCYLS